MNTRFVALLLAAAIGILAAFYGVMALFIMRRT